MIKQRVLCRVLFMSLCCACWLLARAPQTAHAVDPIGQIISYQGLLRSANGTPIADGPQSLSFKIYQAGTSAPVFARTALVPTVGGVFNVFLNVGALAFDPAKSYSLGITFKGVEVRHPIAAVPFALNAKSAASAATAGTFSGALAGDVSGPQSATKVVALQGTAISTTAPANAQVLRFNAATGQYEPSGTSGGTITAVTASAPLTASGGNTPNIALTGVVPVANGGTGATTQNFVDLSTPQTVGGTKTFTNPIGGSITGNAATATSAATATTAVTATTAATATSANGLQGTAVAITPPVAGQVLIYNGTAYVPATPTLGGDVTGTQSATTVASVGGQAAADVASGTVAANAATAASSPNSLVKRDAAGNFAAGTITGNLNGNAATASSAATFTGNLAGDVSGPQSATTVAKIQGRAVAATAPTSGQILIYNGTRNQYEPTTPAAATVQSDGTTITGNGANLPLAVKVPLALSGDATGSILSATNANGGTGGAGSFTINNATNSGDALRAGTNGSGNAIAATGTITATGDINTATQYNIGGFSALSATGGTNSVAVGARAGTNNTGSNNAFVGTEAGYNTTTGTSNAFVGYQAGFYTTTGSYNAFLGTSAGSSNTSGDDNAFVGMQAGQANTWGSYNAFLGMHAGQYNTTGNANAFLGMLAGQVNTTGNANAFVGTYAGQSNTTGTSNIALGYGAGQNLTTGDNNIAIGHFGIAGEAATIRLGTQGTQANTYIAGISGVAVPGAAVYIGTDGHLGTVNSSSRRFKQDIADIGHGSDWLLRLRPVAFRYTAKFLQADQPSAVQYGLIAEEVAKVYPAMVHCDATGQPDGVQYQNLPIMLLNEVQKQQRTIDQQQQALKEQQQTVKEQQQTLKQQQRTLNALLARLAVLEAGHGVQVGTAPAK